MGCPGEGRKVTTSIVKYVSSEKIGRLLPIGAEDVTLARASLSAIRCGKDPQYAALSFYLYAKVVLMLLPNFRGEIETLCTWWPLRAHSAVEAQLK